jgi:Pyruvate/2-oxoacid:ferredoxin oxidoreductase delta subunit
MKRMIVVVLAALAAGSSFSQAPPPTPAPKAPAKTPRLLSIGFGATPSATTSPVASPKGHSDSDPLASLAAKIKLRKLTPEEIKELKNAGPAAPAPASSQMATGSDLQQQRVDALAEYKETIGPLTTQAQQVESECRACDYSCQGTTEGSALTTDTNGNWVVLNTSVQNSTTPECRNCTVLCRERLATVAGQYNLARERAIAKGVYRHELDTGRLVFGTTKN